MSTRSLLMGCGLVGLIALAIWLSTRNVSKPVADDGGGKNAAGADGERAPPTDGTLALPVGAACPDFSAPDHKGAPLSRASLLGRAWVVQLLDLEQSTDNNANLAPLEKLAAQWNDSPYGTDVVLLILCRSQNAEAAARLAEIASPHVESVPRWRFVADVPDDLWTYFAPQSGANGTEATATLTLVDPQGHRRGTYDARSSESLASLDRDLRTVIDERVLIVENRIEPPFLVQALIQPPWVEGRRAAQLAQAADLEVLHDFRFEDRREASGIDFRHRVVDDAGRALVTAHYDHGTGIAVADMDGDELYDIYFVNQVGANRLYKNLGAGRFADVTDQAGVALADRVSVAASFADTDNDGDVDLFVTTVRGGNVLFVNDGQGRFTDVSQEAGLDYRGHSSAAEFFDFDRDGLLDLFVVNVGVYTTETVAEVVNDRFTGPDKGTYRYYVSNADAFAAHLKPERAERSILYRNLGNNRFADVSREMNLIDENWTGDATPLDGNQDGWIDLYLVNMQGHDEYYENVEGKRFERKGRVVFPATPWGSMGVKSFDFNNDGHMDLYITDMHTDMAKDLGPGEEHAKIPSDAMDPSLLATDGHHVWGNAFYRNRGDGTFEEVSDAINAENYWPWGLSSGDLNADGFEDVVIASSMNYPFRYGINSVLLNHRGEKFVDSEYVLGVEPRRGGQTAQPWFELDTAGRDRNHPVSLRLKAAGRRVDRAVVWGALGSRSSVVFDLDNDGDLDIVTNEFHSPPQVLISNLAETHPEMKYVKVRLQGTRSNRDGLGARVRLTAGGQTQTKVYDGQSGYLSQSANPLYFGLGAQPTIEKLEVHWPSGTVQVVESPLSTNEVVDIVEP